MAIVSSFNMWTCTYYSYFQCGTLTPSGSLLFRKSTKSSAVVGEKQLTKIVKGKMGVNNKGDMEYLTASYIHFQTILLFYPYFSEILGVLKFKFYYYSDQQTTCMKKEFVIHSSRKEEACHTTQSYKEKHHGGQKQRERGRSVSKSLYSGFIRKMGEAR